MERELIVTALRAFAAQRPGLEFGNYCSGYGDSAGRAAYFSEMRSITGDLHDARELLRAVELSSIPAESLKAAFRAYSGRLTITEAPDGRAKLAYCAGQYWPTEYRKAVCAIAAQALWEHVRENCMPKPAYIVGDGAKFHTKDEAIEYANSHASEHILSVEERYDGLTAGDWIRRYFLRTFGRRIARRWFN